MLRPMLRVLITIVLIRGIAPTMLDAATPCPPLLDYRFVNLMDEPLSLCEHAGKVVLIVNTASECGYTPQYEGLEKLYRRYRDKGFIVLGFPANDFGGQEPGTNKQIKQFCEVNYGVSFPMFQKVDVNGPAAHPLFELLKSARRGVLGTAGIKWNFTKFLVNGQGDVVARYAPSDTPERIERDLGALLTPPATPR